MGSEDLAPKVAVRRGRPAAHRTGTVHHVHPSVAGNTAVFTAGSERYEIWTTGIVPNQGRTVGEPRQLTNIGYAVTPELSADGRKLVYLAARSREIRLYLRNLDDGKETLLAGPAELHKAVFSPDGEKSDISRAAR